MNAAAYLRHHELLLPISQIGTTVLLSVLQSNYRASAYWRHKALDYPTPRMHGTVDGLMLCKELLVMPTEHMMEELLLPGFDQLEGLANTIFLHNRSNLGTGPSCPLCFLTTSELII